MLFTPETSSPNISSQALQAFIARSVKLLAATTVVGAAAGFGSYFLQSPQWTAKMTVQIGQVTSPGTGGGANTSKLIEAQLTAADRVNLPSFRLAVLKDLGLPAPDAAHAQSALIFDSLRATPAKSVDLINVQASGYSREEAIRAVNASFKALSGEHDKTYVPTVERMKTHLKDVSASLGAAEQDYQRTFSALKGTDSRSTNQDLFTTNILAVISARILALGQQKLLFEEGLEGIRTYPTRVLGDIYAPARPSSPGIVLFSTAGAAIGFFAGLLIALARNARRA